MQIAMPKEVVKMQEKIEPYIVLNGVGYTLSPDAPEDIVNLYYEYTEYVNKLVRERE